MKKVISWLSALCLMAALIPGSVMASQADPGTIDGWTVSGDGNISVVSDNVNGEFKPVIKWTRAEGGSTVLSYAVGSVEEGVYEISVTAKMPGDHGTAWYGVIGDMSGVLQNNTDGYSTLKTEVNVVETNQSMQISLEGGNATEGYISEVVMKKKNGDVIYGENIIANGDFANEVPNAEVGTMNGWEFDERSNAVIAEDTVNGEVKPVIKWQYSAEQGNHRYLRYFIGDIPAGDYKVSFLLACPGNPGGSNYGITAEGLDPSGLNFGRWFNEYTLVEKTVTLTEDKTNQYFQIITDGYGDAEYLYLAEATVCKINADGSFGENLIKNSDFENESDFSYEPDIEGWAASYEDAKLESGTGTYNGVTKPTLAWTHANPDGSQLKKHVKIYYPIGALEAGTYEYDVIIKHTNSGDGRISIVPSSTMQPSVYTSFAKGSGSGGQFVNLKGTVTFDAPVSDAQFIIFTDGYGDTGTLHLYEVSVRKLSAQIEYGENIIENSDFRTIDFTTNYWSITNVYSQRVLQKEVNGEVKNVLEVYYKNGSGSRIVADVGLMVPGTYKLSALMLCNSNAGERFFGITNDTNGGFPDNSRNVPQDQKIPWSNEWTLVEREIVVTNGMIDQKINFWSGYGEDNKPLYITDLSLCRKNADGTYGENIVKNPDFTVEKVDETVNQINPTVVKGWEVLGSSMGNSFTVRTVTGMDGNPTKAVVGYKSSEDKGFLQLKQGVGTEAGKTYCLTFKAKGEGPLDWAGVRVQTWMDGETEKDYWTLNDIFSGASDWAEYKLYYKMPDRDVNGNGIAFTTENIMNSMKQEQMLIIDDVEFCEVLVAADEATGTEEELGPNLISNGDFEAENYGITDLQFAVIVDGEVAAGGAEAFIPPSEYGLVASVTFQNGEATAATPAFVVATYKDGALYDVDIVDNVSITANSNQLVEWNVSVPENLDGGVFTAKAFVWNSLSGLQPIGRVVTVGEMD